MARAFKCSDRTIRRHLGRYQVGGMAALATRSGWRPGRRRISATRVRIIERMKAEGTGNREIAGRLGLTENAIRKQVCPSAPPMHEQPPLPLDGIAASTAVAPVATTTVTAEVMSSPEVIESLPLAATQPATSSPEPTSEEETEPTAMSLDVDPSNRTWDRLLACFGLLDDAAPIFGDRDGVPGAGALCAVPLLVASGIFPIAHRRYGEIGPAF